MDPLMVLVDATNSPKAVRENPEDENRKGKLNVQIPTIDVSKLADLEKRLKDERKCRVSALQAYQGKETMCVKITDVYFEVRGKTKHPRSSHCSHLGKEDFYLRPCVMRYCRL